MFKIKKDSETLFHLRDKLNCLAITWNKRYSPYDKVNQDTIEIEGYNYDGQVERVNNDCNNESNRLVTVK